MTANTGLMNSIQNANNENLDTLFPGGKRPDIVPNAYVSDFLTSVRTRELKSAVDSSSINYNRWEIFPKNNQSPENLFTFYTGLRK